VKNEQKTPQKSLEQCGLRSHHRFGEAQVLLTGAMQQARSEPTNKATQRPYAGDAGKNNRCTRTSLYGTTNAPSSDTTIFGLSQTVCLNKGGGSQPDASTQRSFPAPRRTGGLRLERCSYSNAHPSASAATRLGTPQPSYSGNVGASRPALPRSMRATLRRGRREDAFVSSWTVMFMLLSAGPVYTSNSQ